ncbi:hypothetical protein [Parerythrobacter lacustris]|uniref:Uncharacterized protein n=1 Tax=Parerythrobacter lacustris TaxID=2969984 RepID=A0ABT1XTL3_9SPHN|nr:hypothetical protein [Parerythrobacter lacustris]MCR2834599.1 hypothetical protein [Parerythrobacter lacustris]
MIAARRFSGSTIFASALIQNPAKWDFEKPVHWIARWPTSFRPPAFLAFCAGRPISGQTV